jgi:hypothetical protein
MRAFIPLTGQTQYFEAICFNFFICAMLILFAVAVATSGAPAAVSVQPAQDLLKRVVGSAAAELFELSIDATVCPSSEECAVLADSTTHGRVDIQGSTINSLTFGIGHYLKHRCNASLSWVKTGGMGAAKQNCGSTLAPVGDKLLLKRAVKFTYYQNVVMSR